MLHKRDKSLSQQLSQALDLTNLHWCTVCTQCQPQTCQPVRAHSSHCHSSATASDSRRDRSGTERFCTYICIHAFALLLHA